MKTFRALALSLLVCAGAFAQNATLMPVPKLQFLDRNGIPLAGGFVYTCVAGSSCPGNPLASYTDTTGTVANPNPVVLDGSGMGSIWLARASSYKIVVQDSLGGSISTTDGVSATASVLGQLSATANTANGYVQLDSSGHIPQTVMSYLQGATGSVARSYMSKLQESLSVLDFGADATGATDAGAKIQAAVNAAAVGQTVRIPKGTYLINTAITIKPQLKVVCDGATLTSSADINMFAYIKSNSDTTGYPGEFEISGCTATGSGAAGAGGFLNVNANFPLVSVHDNNLSSFGTAVYLRRAYDSQVADNTIGSVNYGILIAGESHAFVAINNFVTACTTICFGANYNNAGDNPLHNITLVGGAYQHAATGVWVENIYGFHAINLYAEGNTAADLQIGYTPDGSYSRAAYETVIDGLETSSAATINVNLQSAVNFKLLALAFNAGVSTTGTLVKADGFSDRGEVEYIRYPTGTVTSTAPFDFTQAPTRFLVRSAGRSLYPAGMTDAIQFGSLGNLLGSIYQGYTPAGRNALTIASQNQDLQLRAGPSGIVRYQDSAGNDYLNIDTVNANVYTTKPFAVGAYNNTVIQNSGNVHQSAGTTTASSCTVGGYLVTTVNGGTVKLAYCN